MNKRSYGKFSLAFTSSALATGVICWGGAAFASRTISFSPSLCKSYCSAQSTCSDALPVGVSTNGNNGQMVNATSNGVGIFCPVTGWIGNSGSGPTSPPVSVTLKGWANASSMGMRACRTYGTGFGGACGGYSDPTASSVFSFSPSDLSGWSGGSINDSYWFELIMWGVDSSGSMNTLFEYQVGETG